MKITNDQVGAVEQQEAERTARKASEKCGMFGDLLARELDAVRQDGGAARTQGAGVKPLGTSPLLHMNAPVAPNQQAERTIMDNLERLLGEWEEYAQRLETPGEEAGLKDAYAVLARIGGEVERIKTENPDLASRNPELKSLVDEMEILSVTETIKFNRGDYV